MFGTFTTRKSESKHSATRWTVLLAVTMVAFSSSALSDNPMGDRESVEELLPPNIEIPVEDTMALGPHPSDPAYAKYQKEYEEEVRRRNER